MRLKALGDHLELSEFVDDLRTYVYSSEALIQLPERQEAAHPAVLESLKSPVVRLEVAMEAVQRQFSFSQPVSPVVEPSVMSGLDSFFQYVVGAVHDCAVEFGSYPSNQVEIMAKCCFKALSRSPLTLLVVYRLRQA